MAEKREREEGEIEENAAKAARLEDDEGTQECDPGTPIVEQEKEEKCDDCGIVLDPLSERISCHGNYCNKVQCVDCSKPPLKDEWCCVQGALFCSDCSKEMRNTYRSLPTLMDVVSEDIDLVGFFVSSVNPTNLHKEFVELLTNYDPKQEEEYHGCAFEAKFKKTQKNLARIAGRIAARFRTEVDREQFVNEIRRKKEVLPLLYQKLPLTLKDKQYSLTE